MSATRIGSATRVVAGVSVPDTAVISRAIEFARERSEPYLFNHSMRSWLFAAIIAQRNQTVHDGEVLAVATILHDVGLAEEFNGPLRFEVEGANTARAFARDQHLDDRQTQLIRDTVVLNSTPSIALHKEAEVALSTMGYWSRLGRLGLRGDTRRSLRRSSRSFRGWNEETIHAGGLPYCLDTSRHDVRQLRARL